MNMDNNHRETVPAIAGDQRVENVDWKERAEHWMRVADAEATKTAAECSERVSGAAAARIARLTASLQNSDELRAVYFNEIRRYRAALERIRNGLHAHNRPDVPLPNETRIALRDIADLALEQPLPTQDR